MFDLASHRLIKCIFKEAQMKTLEECETEKSQILVRVSKSGQGGQYCPQVSMTLCHALLFRPKFLSGGQWLGDLSHSGMRVGIELKKT